MYTVSHKDQITVLWKCHAKDCA